MNHVVSVAMGDMQTGAAPAVLETVGVGSCVAVILYDPVAKVGGMAHAILPTQSAAPASLQKTFRYVDASVLSLIEKLIAAGARRDRLVAKLVGGAHMFELFGEAGRGIGAQNVEEARVILRENQIPIAGEETGGSVGRNVRFDLASGICSVETHM
jgi:chemotaxis protein CheD